jgi:hypothetical protein
MWALLPWNKVHKPFNCKSEIFSINATLIAVSNPPKTEHIYIIIIHYESSLFSRVQFPNFSRCFTMKSPPWLPIRTAFLGASIPGPAPAGERTNNGWEVHRGFILFGGFLNHGTNPQIIQT